MTVDKVAVPSRWSRWWQPHALFKIFASLISTDAVLLGLTLLLDLGGGGTGGDAAGNAMSRGFGWLLAIACAASIGALLLLYAALPFRFVRIVLTILAGLVAMAILAVLGLVIGAR